LFNLILLINILLFTNTLLFNILSFTITNNLVDVASPCTSVRIDINFWSSNGWHTDSIIRRKRGYGIATLCDPSRCCRMSLVAPNLRIEKKTLSLPSSLSLSLSISRFLQSILTQNASPFHSPRALETKGDRSFLMNIIYLLCNCE